MHPKDVVYHTNDDHPLKFLFPIEYCLSYQIYLPNNRKQIVSDIVVTILFAILPTNMQTSNNQNVLLLNQIPSAFDLSMVIKFLSSHFILHLKLLFSSNWMGHSINKLVLSKNIKIFFNYYILPTK